MCKKVIGTGKGFIKHRDRVSTPRCRAAQPVRRSVACRCRCTLPFCPGGPCVTASGNGRAQKGPVRAENGDHQYIFSPHCLSNHPQCSLFIRVVRKNNSNSRNHTLHEMCGEYVCIYVSPEPGDGLNYCSSRNSSLISDLF